MGSIEFMFVAFVMAAGVAVIGWTIDTERADRKNKEAAKNDPHKPFTGARLPPGILPFGPTSADYLLTRPNRSAGVLTTLLCIALVTIAVLVGIAMG